MEDSSLFLDELSSSSYTLPTTINTFDALPSLSNELSKIKWDISKTRWGGGSDGKARVKKNTYI